MIERVAIVGAGGHAREVWEILRSAQSAGRAVAVLGFVAEDSTGLAGTVAGLPVLGGFEWFLGGDAAGAAAICAVGTPATARRLASQIADLGVPFASAVAPSAWIAPSARMGDGVMVFPQVVVNADAHIGGHVTLNVASTVSHDSRVGDFCSVGPGAHLAGNVVLGEGCFVGMGANLIQGVTVGPGTVIGAGAVVLDDLEGSVTAVGVPARVVGPAREAPMSRRPAPAGGRAGP